MRHRLLCLVVVAAASLLWPAASPAAQLPTTTFESSVCANATFIELPTFLRSRVTPLEQHPGVHTACTAQLGSPPGVFAGPLGVQP